MVANSPDNPMKRTGLVGKNEPGKTALRETLHEALPLGTAKYAD